MLDSFLTFINQQKLDVAGKRTLLTISGGVDSVVMANLFHRAGFDAAFAHCNFGLRGEESLMDEQFVKDLAHFYGFPFFVKHLNAKAFANEHTVSTQMAARRLRYEWFEEVRSRHSFQYIATAHHANDHLETAILNLVRGTGLAGLHGILPRNGFLIRPLLFATKQQILDYAVQQDLTWREDRSNNSLDYKRNIVRKKVVPVLKEMNPSLETTFGVTSEKILAAERLLSEFLECWKTEAVSEQDDQILISIHAVLSSSEPAYRLWSVLEPYGFNFLQVSNIVKALSSHPGKLFFSPSHVLLKDRERLILKVKGREESAEDVLVQPLLGIYCCKDETLHFSDSIKPLSFSKEPDSNIVFVDKSKLVFPLTWRRWNHGDIFYPIGMKGKRKKISDLLVDRKLDIFQKERVSVLLNGNGEIIWVTGFRLDERYRITEETKATLRIEKK
jgi:tRNA(Ile)-lysidine synthase